eukprot:jgi/Astpho2/4453/Aster-00063
MQNEKQRRKKLWMAAIKPPMYTVAYVPILVSAAAAYSLTGIFPISQFLQLSGASTLIIAWLNLSNDSYDADMDVDGDKPESVVNLTGNRRAVFWAAWACFFAGTAWLGGLVTGLRVQGDTRIAKMLGAAICAGYLYQGPPFRLSYKGLGEPLCFMAFGPLALGAFYLAQVTHPLGSPLPVLGNAVVVCSIVVGITTTAILFCSHFHQIDGDRAAGKLSPLVRLGTKRALSVLHNAIRYALLLPAAAAALEIFSWWWFPFSILPLIEAFRLEAFSLANHHNPAAVRPLKLYAIRVHVACGVALALSLACGRLF